MRAASFKKIINIGPVVVNRNRFLKIYLDIGHDATDSSYKKCIPLHISFTFNQMFFKTSKCVEQPQRKRFLQNTVKKVINFLMYIAYTSTDINSKAVAAYIKFKLLNIPSFIIALLSLISRQVVSFTTHYDKLYHTKIQFIMKVDFNIF